jgi:hypothetical protein
VISKQRQALIICVRLPKREEMKSEEMARFVTDSIEPLKDQIYGNRYRVAAHLKDGTYLPCVVLQSRGAQLKLALRRFKEERSNYESIVGSFVADGSRVADYELKDIEISPFAWPLKLLKTIHGETIMGWTAFVAEMKDGTMYSYGTSFNIEFFDLPVGYSHAEIARVHSGMAYSKTSGLVAFSIESVQQTHPLREKPFFTCYSQTLDAVR